MIDSVKLVKYLELKNYQIDRNENEYNIVYLEGVNSDGTLNKDLFNEFNDLRLVLKFHNNLPIIQFLQVATTEPGRLDPNKTNPKGPARIAFGQFQAWKHGFHKNNPEHPALVQTAPISVFRDKNLDHLRTGDLEETGWFGINQHSTKPGWGGTKVENFSAGCLVGRWWNFHLHFLNLLKLDHRYQKDHNYIYRTTIIDGVDYDNFKKSLL